MVVTIYDYKNSPQQFPLKDVEISSIFVTVMSGDEVVKIKYSDNSEEIFDSSIHRELDFMDCEYEVTKEMIGEWLNYIKKPNDPLEFSYARAIHFGDLESKYASRLLKARYKQLKAVLNYDNNW